MTWTDNSFKFPFQKEQEKRNDPKYKNVPLIVAPGKEDAYLEEKAKHDAAKIAEAERIIQERKRQRRNKQKLMNNSKRNQRKNFKNNLKMTTATVGKGC